MKPVRVAIVDDETLARVRLRRLLETESKGLFEVVAECVDVGEMLKAAKETEIDVVFLDIDMPGGDGFSGLRQWLGPLPMVVFVTAHEIHGVRAFDAGAVDYLLKPISAGRLKDALVRLQIVIGRTTIPHENEDSLRRIPLQLGHRITLVPEQEIISVEASGNYVEVQTHRGRFIVRRTLTAFVEEISSDDFVRLHRSLAVRRDAIVDIRPLGSGRYKLGLRDGREVTSGRGFQESIRSLLKPAD
jgi:two-component system LytT family response regulator